MVKHVFGVFVALSLSFMACTKPGPPPDTDELSSALKHPDVVILDVRSPKEFAGGHVPGAVNLPVAAIGGATSILKNKDAPIVVHCAAGVRSARAIKSLSAQGYTNLIDAQTPETVTKALGVQLQN